MKNQRSEKNYYLGLDIGTDSVGYAVTDKEYKPLKYKGEPMMGVHLIDPAANNEECRAFRTARRRLDRRQQRVALIREIFALEIAKVDMDFYKRLDASALVPEDKGLVSANSFFNDVNYTDKEYHRQFPTIHHLICDLINKEGPFDVRLVYLAVAYLVAHRGHFLNEVEKDNIESVLDFNNIYSDFISYFEEQYDGKPWDCDVNDFQDVLKEKNGISKKEYKLINLLFGGKKPKFIEGDLYNKALLVKLLAGGKVACSSLFCKEEYADVASVSLSMKDEELDGVLGELGDDADLIILAKKLYDWSILTDLVPKSGLISEAKVSVYEQHQKDLRFLKYFVKKYCFNKYYEVFRDGNIKGNYVSYSYNIKNAKDAIKTSKTKKEIFCDYILKLVKSVGEDNIEECDKELYDDMVARLDKDVLSFMPKQVDGDNRVIPYQLYYFELAKILDVAKAYLPFLEVKDCDGYSPREKILSTFEFRIPYYVGPLNNHSKKAWIEKKASEKIYPWNFDDVVDLDKSETAFIRRMTNFCTYVPGEKVMPKNSLVYSKFMVLNEINNIKVNGVGISASEKQSVFNDLFMQRAKVTRKQIEGYLRSKCNLGEDDIISGIDETVKSSLKPYHFFKGYIENGVLSNKQVEDILEMKAYSEDKIRFKRWLCKEFPALEEKDCKDIANQKFKDFGRLSRRFLGGISGVNLETGEMYNSIMDALWDTNYNLMRLLSSDFTFAANIEEIVKEYYSDQPLSLTERLNDMYVSNAVKRPIIRTLDIVKDIVKVNGGAPTKVFVEMARGATEDQKNNRTKSRKDQILEFYKSFDEAEVRELKRQLAEKDDRALRGEALYLYFIQLGKSMYSGTPINIEDLASGEYNVDHIYPQCFVKDDSITNKVLVTSKENSDKGNEFPIKPEIRAKMYSTWKALYDKGLMSDEKFRRLTRTTGFDEKEKMGFINRQLVETRQSTKAVATLLKELMPDTEIVYVKAGLASEFRQNNNLLKARTVNDLHHAKDAYINVVVGNVYSTMFNKQWFRTDHEYSIKTETLCGKFKKTAANGEVVWGGQEMLERVIKTVNKNNIHLTKYAFCRHGGFFDQMPLKAGTSDNLISRKKGMDVTKYGGYNKPAASFFALVRFGNKKKTDLIFMPVELLFADKFLKDKVFAAEYAKNTVKAITNVDADFIEFPLGIRPIKVNTVLELDGFRIFVSGKATGGSQLLCSPFMSLTLLEKDEKNNLGSNKWEVYIKRLEKFAERFAKDKKAKIDERFDKITEEENRQLYAIYAKKINSNPFSLMPGGSVAPVIDDGFEKFEKLTLEEQVIVLLNIGTVFKTCRKSGCDLTIIGGKNKSGCVQFSSVVSNWKKRYSTAYIVDSSASGLHETKSQNLFDLI